MSEQEKELQETGDDDLFEHYRLQVDPGQTPLRVDKFVSTKIANVTRNKVQSAIDDEYVKVNGESVKSNYKVKGGDEIVVSLPQPPRNPELVAEDIPLTIEYEDEDLLVVNKPDGMVVHPAYMNWTGTLVNALLFYLNKDLPAVEGNEIRPGLVHRIDKDTSGLLLIAKNEEALSHLAKQFYKHTVERSYWALVWGEPQEDEGTINVPIARSYKDRRVMDVFPEDSEFGKHAITHYKVLKRMHFVSLVECRLETGRTHQIRIHMKHLGHPLFNDATYGGDKVLKGTLTTKYKQFVNNAFALIQGQALHAKTLGFRHPADGRTLRFDSELPPDFQALVSKWEKYVEVMG